MRTSEVALPRARPIFDAVFLRRLVWATGATPIVLLAWDAARHTLGVNGVNYAIRTTGLMTLIFLVLALAVTPLRKLTGIAMFIAVRRSLGLFALFYLVVHVSLFYGLDRAASLASTLHEIFMRRYLQLGAIAFLLMIPLAVTSTDAMVRRLGAARWKLLHRLTYVIAVLGCIHYVLLVKADVRQPLAFGGVVALLLGFRAVSAFVAARRRPAGGALAPMARRPTWTGELRVIGSVRETPDVRTLRLGSPSGGALPFTFAPGQYLNVTFELEGEKVRRSYTIASSAEQKSHCEISVKRAENGWVSRHVHEVLAEGDRIQVSAPAGAFVFDPGSSDDIVTLIGGGVGITPLMSIVRSLTDRGWPGRIEMILSMKTREDIVFAEELAALGRRFEGLHVTVTLTRESSPEWTGPRGHVTKELLAELLPKPLRGPIFVCGPNAMMRDVKAALRALGVDEGSIRTEAFVSPGAKAAAPTGDADDELAHDVTFEQQDVVVSVPRRLTLLEAAEESGVDIPFECRSGICGQCKVKLLEGEVTMAVEDALSTSEKLEGIVLACQARARTALIVDV